MKKHNFFAGPSILPKTVKTQASEAALDYKGKGLSLMEVSHRGDDFKEILHKTESNVRELYGIKDDYAVLFLTGGASTQFFMSAMNLYGENDHVGYLDTGTWSTKAIKEANHYGKVSVLASSKDSKFSYIPKDFDIPENLKYIHLTGNNTIYGTQQHDWVDCHCPLIGDMSSDIFSKPIPFERFGLIYAGAQKNVGPAGVTLVIVKKDLLGRTGRHIPTMLDYRTHIEKKSAFNTPPVFPIYVTMLTLNWILENGGVKAMEIRNTEKASTLYEEIDNNPMFEGHSAVEDRSVMNATFTITDQSKESEFLDKCKIAGIVGIKGHRSIGGFRASMYNALGIESVKVLVDVMKSMKKQNQDL